MGGGPSQYADEKKGQKKIRKYPAAHEFVSLHLT